MEKLTKWQNVCPEKDTKEVPEKYFQFIFKKYGIYEF
jgi:hypothetical protein